MKEGSAPVAVIPLDYNFPLTLYKGKVIPFIRKADSADGQ